MNWYSDDAIVHVQIAAKVVVVAAVVVVNDVGVVTVAVAEIQKSKRLAIKLDIKFSSNAQMQ